MKVSRRVWQFPGSKPALPLVLLLAAALVPAGCKREEGAFYASGTFEATEVDVGSQATGLLVMLEAREGDLVKKGELLAQVDAEKLEIERDLVRIQLEQVDLELDLVRKQVSANQISLENGTRTLERFQALKQAKSATDQKVDDLATAVKLDRTRLNSSLKELERPEIRRRELGTQLKLIERQIQDARAYAPLAGQVIERFAEPGEVITVGRPLVRIADLSLLEIRVYLSPAFLGEVRLGGQVRIRADGAPERDFTGKVAWVSPVAEFTPRNVQTPEARAELVYAVKVEVPNEEGVLKVGMPADVYFQ